ncbi:MAG: hypothetical protein KKA73_00165 [Chloroflexi bacterium]|nr:hypothetical protein [Chloroflexota bacterium]MBU1746076.1 hypothetical protein [Chloroflexota bacterium]
MKQALMVLLVVAVLWGSTTAAAFAAGGQVRGDNGQGAVHQVQVQDPPPFP